MRFILLAAASCLPNPPPDEPMRDEPMHKHSATTSAAPPAPTATAPVVNEAKTRFATEHGSVRLINLTRVDGERSSLKFRVALGRPDLGLDQPDNSTGEKLTVDIAPPLRPDLMYLSAASDHVADSGSMCDRPRFPHECEVYELSGDERTAADLARLLKITFEDGSYAAVAITVPVPPALAVPEIVAPTRTPAQGGMVELSFRDVGADSYGVTVRMCRHYGNDGINPCLNDQRFALERKGGELTFVAAWKEQRATVSVNSGVVTLATNMVHDFEESVRLEVEARKTGELRGLPYVSVAHASRSLPR